MKLSETMQAALDAAKANGGRLERWSGGFWTYPGCTWEVKNLPMPTRVPEVHFGTQTIHALIDRAVVKISRRSHGEDRGYIVEVEVVEEAHSA